MKTPLQPLPCDLRAFEKVPDLYLILSPELVILTASDAYLKASCTVRDEMAGKHLFDSFPATPMYWAAGAAELLRHSLQQVLATGQPHRMDVQRSGVPATAKPGGFIEKFWQPLNTPVLDEQGQVQYIIHKVEDITDQIKAEQESKQGRELLKTTIDSSLDMIQVFEAVRNESGEIIDFKWILNNRTSEEIYGDVVGKNLLEQNPGVVWIGIFDTFKRVVETGIPDQTERHYVHEQFDGWFYQSTVKLGDGVATTTRDITKRKQAEQELRTTKESLQAFQEQLQMVLANTASSIMLLRPIPDATNNICDFVYLYTNDQLLKSVNRTSLVGRRFTEEFPGVKGTELFQHYTQVVTEGGTWSGETHINFDGFDVWAQVYATRVKGNLLVTYFGITERKKAEEALMQSKKLIQTVFDVSLNPIAYHKAMRDDSGKIVDFEFQLENKAANRYTASDRTGKRYSEAYPGIRDTIVFKKYCEVVETGSKLDTEVQINLQGKDIWFHLLGVKMGDGLVATAVDITDRKKAEQEILRLKDEIAQKATDRYSSLFNSIDEGFCIIELLYDENGKVVDYRWLEANPMYEKHSGIINPVGKLGSEIIPTTENYWLENYDKVLKTGKASRFENWHEASGRWYQTYASRIGDNNSRQIAVVFDDISERKRREEHQNFRVNLDNALRTLTDPIAIQRVALRMMREHLGGTRALFAEALAAGETMKILTEDRDPNLLQLEGVVLSFSDFTPEALREAFSGKPVWREDVFSDGHTQEQQAEYTSLGTRSWLSTPLVKDGRFVANFTIHCATPRKWTEEEIALVHETAERTWSAVERAKAEEALRESKTLLSDMLEAIPVGLGLLNADGDLVIANKELYRFLPSGRMPSKDPETLWRWSAFNLDGSIVEPQNWPGARAARGETVVPGIEMRYIGEDGTELRAQVSTVPNKDAEGNIVGQVVAITDITERVKAEEALRISEAKFRRLSESGIVAVAFFDIGGPIVDANDAFLDMLGVTKDELQTEKVRWDVYTAKEWLPRTLQAIEEFKQTGYISPYEKQFYHTSGELRWGIFAGATLGDGKTGVSLVIDITKRKKAEAALLESEMRFASLFTASPVPFMVLTPNPPDYTITAANEAYFPATLTTPKTLIGRRLFDVFPDDPSRPGQLGSEALAISLEKVLDTKQKDVMPRVRYDLLTSNGFVPHWWEAINAPMLDANGNVTAIIHQVHRVTELQFAEERERESRENQAFLLQFSDTLRLETNHEAVANKAIQMLIEQLELDRSYIVSYYLEENQADLDYQIGNDTVPPLPDHFVLSDYPEAFKATLKGTLVIEDELERQGLSEAERRNSGKLGMRAMVAATLRKEERGAAWSMVAINSRPRRWTSGEIKLVEEVAERTWSAIERAKVEEALRQSEKRFHSIANLVPDLLWDSEPDGSTNWYNQRWLEYTGQRLDQAIGWGWVDAIHPDDREGSVKRYGEAVEAGRPLRQEQRIRRHDGVYRWFVVSASPLKDESGHLVKMYGAATDIHDRKQVEEALRQSEEKYRSLFDSIDEGYCIIQMLYDESGKAIDFRYLQVNQAFERNTGLHDAEGKTIRELAPDIEPKWMEIYDQVAQTGIPLRFEESSEALHHIFSLYAFQFGDPSERQVAVIFSDITEHKKSLEALRQSEEQFRLFVTASSDIIYKMNADWSRMYRLSGKDFLIDAEEPATSWMDVYIPEEDRMLVRAAIQEAIRTKTIFKLEHRENKADGTVGWVSSRAIPVVDEQGNIREWFGTASDISLRKQAEQQLYDLNESLEQQVAERTHELQESKQLLQTVFDTTPIQISILKAVRDEQGHIIDFRIELANKELERETGRRDLVGKLYATEYPGIKKVGLFDVMLQVMETGQSKGLEYFYSHEGFGKWYSSMFVRLHDGLVATNLDITEQKRVEAENLNLKLKQQKQLLIAILEAQEEERSRISESLHNGVAQILYAAKLRLEGLTRKAPAEYVEKLDRLLQDAIHETRVASHELVPNVLREFGLEQAILEMCARFEDSTIRLECEIEAFQTKLDAYQELALYRISQELINNIIKHSNATEAKLLLYQEDELIHLKVRDNGIGFNERPLKHNGIGLRSIENTLKLLNGTFDFSIPSSGTGTQVTITIPIERK